MRAYNYQILCSILAWIKLGEDEILYLEGAEDFDQVRGDDVITVQVKDTKKSGSITLRSGTVVDALSHYWGHRLRNPNRKIAFHYLTTSDIGIEQGDPLGYGIPGIELWEKIKVQNGPEQELKALERLKGFIIGLERISENLKDFLKFSSNDDILDFLIKPITWQTNSDSSELVLKDIKDSLVLHGYRIDIGSADAEKVLAALHSHAWHFATKDKERALCRADFIRIFDEHTRISIPIAEYAERKRPATSMVEPPSINLAPLLPPVLIQRTDVLSKIKRGLLDPTNPESNASHCVGLIGMPGVGKSILAALLANDPEVKAKYPNGVLWATLGKHPDVLSLLLGWLPVLGGQPFNVSSAETASAMVRGALATGRYLVVVDDAWTAESVELFRVGGPDCATILTTRDSMVARRFGAQPQQIDVLAPDEAIDLLRKAAGEDFDNSERRSAEQLVEVLEYLPLAIDIAGAQIADGISINNLKNAIEREIARLDLLDLTPADATKADDTAQKRLSVEASFALSLRGIGDKMVNAFAWLGVVPEDAAFNARAMQTIWGVEDITEAEYRLAQLRRRALLQDVTGDGQVVRRYRLHDLLHDFARRLLTGNPEATQARLEIQAYSLTLTMANRVLIERYQALVPSGCWGDLPDDGYVHQHLTYHIEQAGLVDVFDDLLHQSDQEGGNAWFLARERLGQIAGYVSDLERIRRSSVAGELESPQSLSRAISVSMIQSSLVSRAHIIPDALAVACVRHQFWTPAQGLDYARLKPHGIGRIWMLTALAPFLGDRWENEIADKVFSEATDTLSKRGLAASLGVEERALDLLIPVLPESLKQRLSIMSSAAPVNTQARMTVQMVPHLDDATCRRLFITVAERCSPDAPGRESDKLEALALLATVDTQQFGSGWEIELLTRACQSGDINAAYNVFKIVAPLTSEVGQTWILSFLEELKKPEFSAGALFGFSDNLTEKNRLLAIRLANEHQEPIIKYWLVGRLSCGLREPQDLLRSCIQLIRLLPKDHRKFSALHDFLRCTPPAWRLEIENAAIDAGAEFGFGDLGVLPLQEFTRRLSPKGLERMADIVVNLGSDFDRTQTLPALIACVDDSVVPTLCHALLNSLRSSSNRADFAPFGNRIPKDLLPEFLTSCRIGDEGKASEVIATAAPFISSAVSKRELSETFSLLLDRAQGMERVRVAVASLTKGLTEYPEKTKEELVRCIRDLMNHPGSALETPEKNGKALRILLSLMPISDRADFILSLLVNEFIFLSDYHRYPYVAALAQACPRGMIDDIAVEVNKIRDAQHRAELLCLLARRSQDKEADFFRQALEAAKSIPEDHNRYSWIERWASHMPQNFYSDVLSLIHSCKSPRQRDNLHLLTFPIQPRKERRTREAIVRRMSGKDLATLHDGVIQHHFFEILSIRQWRELTTAKQGTSDFPRFVLCLDPLNNQDLYMRALTSTKIRKPDNIDLIPWLSFGIAAASLPKDKIFPWIIKHISDLSTTERSASLEALEFLLPILNALGDSTLVENVTRSITLNQKWWP